MNLLRVVAAFAVAFAIISFSVEPPACAKRMAANNIVGVCVGN